MELYQTLSSHQAANLTATGDCQSTAGSPPMTVGDGNIQRIPTIRGSYHQNGWSLVILESVL